MGGFQAISLVAGLYLLGRSRGRRYAMCGYILAVVAIGYSLLLSDSRAAMLACITGVVVLFWKNVKEFLAVKRIRSVLIMPLKVENTITLGIKGEVMRSMKEHSMR
jgi:hypothetical protein